MSEVTVLPDVPASGKERDAAALLPAVYDELRRLAAAHLAREPSGDTLQPTALVHEAWLRLVGGTESKWKYWACFFVAAVHAMRRTLVEHARRELAIRHGGGQARVGPEGMEVAETLGTSERTFNRHWLCAKPGLSQRGARHGFDPRTCGRSFLCGSRVPVGGKAGSHSDILPFPSLRSAVLFLNVGVIECGITQA